MVTYLVASTKDAGNRPDWSNSVSSCRLSRFAMERDGDSVFL